MSSSSSSAETSTISAIESGVDVLLVLLYSPGSSGTPGEPIKGITRLQKLIFLLWKEGKFYATLPDLYDFKAYDFGPCMDDLYDDIEFVQEAGLVNVEEVSSGNEYEAADEESFLRDLGIPFVKRDTRRDFSLTETGMFAGRDLFEGITDEDRMQLRLIKRRYNEMPFFSLLKYVYKKYPRFAEKSILFR